MGRHWEEGGAGKVGPCHQLTESEGGQIPSQDETPLLLIH